MRYCPRCGTPNEDNSLSCAICGEGFPQAPKPKKKTAFPGKLLAIVGAGVLGLGLVIGGIAAAVSLLSGGMERAMDKTANALAEHMEEKTQLQQFCEIVEERLESGKFSLQAQYETEEFTVFSDTDYKRADKCMAGGMVLTDAAAQESLDLSYSVQKDTVQIAFPDKTWNVYGFTFRDLAKKYGESFLSEILPFAVPESGSVEPFGKVDVEAFLENHAGEAYRTFKESVKFTKLDKREIKIADRNERCTVYRLVWSSKALNDMLSALAGAGIGSGLTDWIGELVPELEPDCLFYINSRGYLVGVDFVAMGNQYLFVLEGEEDPWEKFSLQIKSLYADTRVYEGEIIEHEGVTRMVLSGDDGIYAELRYNDETGEFRVYAKPVGDILSGFIKAEDGKAALCLYRWDPETGSVRLTLEFDELQEIPKPIAEYYTDLLSMSLTEWQRLLLDLDVRLPGFE